jgi:hypothetical protein
VALAATGLVAVAFHPVRERVQRWVNRLMYGRRDEPYAVLTELGRRLEATLSPDSVLSTIAASVREALRVPYAAITLHGTGGDLPVSRVGDPWPGRAAGSAGVRLRAGGRACHCAPPAW